MAKKVQTTLDFDRELFKRSVLYNVKTLYRKNIEEANDQEIFQAVGYAIKDAIVDHWMTTQKEYEKKDPKIVYYMSMELIHSQHSDTAHTAAVSDIATECSSKRSETDSRLRFRITGSQ